MKLLCFNDYRVGVLKGDNVVDITAVIQNIPHHGPGDRLRGGVQPGRPSRHLDPDRPRGRGRRSR